MNQCFPSENTFQLTFCLVNILMDSLGLDLVSSEAHRKMTGIIQDTGSRVPLVHAIVPLASLSMWRLSHKTPVV